MLAASSVAVTALIGFWLRMSQHKLVWKARKLNKIYSKKKSQNFVLIILSSPLLPTLALATCLNGTGSITLPCFPEHLRFTFPIFVLAARLRYNSLELQLPQWRVTATSEGTSKGLCARIAYTVGADGGKEKDSIRLLHRCTYSFVCT